MNASLETQQSLQEENLAEKEKLTEKLEEEEKLKARIQQLTEEKALYIWENNLAQIAAHPPRIQAL